MARRRLLGLALGLTGTFVTWGYLVWAAIDFGGSARDGEDSAWLFLLFATLGATACMFGFLILANKVSETLRGEAPPPRPSRSSTPGKRVAR